MSTNKLTPEQEARMPLYVKKWIDIGINTDRLDYDRTVDIIHDVQVHLRNQEKTPVIIFDNPLEAWIACNYAANGKKVNELKACVEDYFAGNKPKFKMEPFVTPYLNGSFSASVFAYYDFYRDELGVDFSAEGINERYEIWKKTTELGMIYNLEGVTGTVQNMCIVSEKPTTVKLNDKLVIHCDGGPAIEYAGHGDIRVFALNGVVVPEWLAVTHPMQIPIERINEITNADVRTEFVGKVGTERLLSLGKKIDTWENYIGKDDKWWAEQGRNNKEWWARSQYELWDMQVLFAGVDYAPHLKMLNQTTKVWHVEAVAPDVRTISDALKSRYGRILDITGIA